MNPEKILAKLIEATTDVFFNIPQVMTAQLWGKWSSAFFYEFDHVGDSGSSGKRFLRPLPLVSKRESKGTTAHGDELGFLFDVYDVFGNRINGAELRTPRDKKTRRNFIDLIVKFAYINSTEQQLKLNDQILSRFQAEATNFVKISESISIEKDFRFCQLSLWGAPPKATQQVSCKFLSEGLNTLTKPLPGLIGGNKFKIF